MSDYKWCHGPSCHKSHTQDRIRGSKGSKVLRTKRIKQDTYIGMFSYFCSQGCYNDFAHKHMVRIVALAPRNEPLETPIEDPKKETTEHQWGSYTRTTIKERVDTSME